MNPAAFYFGCLDPERHGHFIYENGVKCSLDPARFGIPWPIKMIDTGLLHLLGVKDEVTGIAYHSMTVNNEKKLWHAFVWWDRSGDTRPNSNSGFYVTGFDKDQKVEAFEFAKRYWPEVVERKGQPKLQLFGVEGAAATSK